MKHSFRGEETEHGTGAMMVDRTLQMFLMTIFGLGGAVILLNAWLTPLPMMERIAMSTFAIAGLALAWLLRHFLMPG